MKPNNAAAVGDREGIEIGMDKSFGFSKELSSRYVVGEEIGRGHFGYTCSAFPRKGDLKGQKVAVKVVPKAKVRLSLCIFIYLMDGWMD